MNKLALISTYCNDENKLNALRNTIQEYKNLGVDIFVYSPIKLPTDIEKECKFLFYTDENPVLEYPIRGQLYWWAKGNLKFTKKTSDYGWASNYQLKKLINIASTYDYDIYYLTIYDLDFDDNVRSLIKNNVVNVVSPSTRGWDYSLYFTPFDKQTMAKAEKFFDYSKYVSDSSICAEYTAKEWVEELGLTLQEKAINDTISETRDMFNLSFSDNYKLFIHNKSGEFKFIFGKPRGVIKVLVNDKLITTNIKHHFLHSTGFNVEEVSKFKIISEDGVHDYTHLVKQTSEIFKITTSY